MALFEWSILKRTTKKKVNMQWGYHFLGCLWSLVYCVRWSSDSKWKSVEEQEHVLCQSMFSLQSSAAEDTDVVRNWHLTTPCMLFLVLIRFPASFFIHDQTQNKGSLLIWWNVRHTDEGKRGLRSGTFRETECKNKWKCHLFDFCSVCKA